MFLRVSIWISKWCALRPLPVLEVTTIGRPVVSCPYMAAAEMPMPCWPRDCLSRWNLEPYSSLPKILGTWALTMPGPLSSTAIT